MIQCVMIPLVFSIVLHTSFKDYLKLFPDEQGNEYYIKELEKF